MNICSKGLATIKNLWHKVTPELEVILEDVITFTGKILKLENNPAIQVIEALIPTAGPYIAAINIGINAITTTASILEDTNIVTKLQALITEVQILSPAAANAQVWKLASVIVQSINNVSGATPLTEAESDSLTQLKIIVDKHNETITA